MAKFNSLILSWDSNDKLEYVSQHTQHNADKNSPGWYIKRLSWSGSLLTNVEELKGAHNNRAQLNWE